MQQLTEEQGIQSEVYEKCTNILRQYHDKPNVQRFQNFNGTFQQMQILVILLF